MLIHLTLVLTMAAVTADAQPIPAGDPPPEQGIPAALSTELRQLLEATTSEDAAQRTDAAAKLGALRERAALAVPYLIRLLDGKDDDVALQAGVALQYIGKPAVEPCIAALQQASGKLRAKLIRVLAKSDDPRATEALLPLMEHTDSGVRRTVLLSWRAFGEPRAVRPIVRALHDEDEDVRQAAAMLAGNIKDRRVLDALVETVKHDKEGSVRVSATISLGCHRDAMAVPVLVGVMQDEREQVWLRGWAAHSLGQIADARALEHVFAVLKDEQADARLRQLAAAGLGDSRSQQAVAPLTALLTDTSAPGRARAAAAEALGNLQGNDAIAALTQIAHAKEDHGLVRCRAAESIIDLTKGAIDDLGIVAALGAHYPFPEGYSRTDVGDDAERTKKSLKLVAEHGKTEAVRAAAKQMLRD